MIPEMELRAFKEALGVGVVELMQECWAKSNPTELDKKTNKWAKSIFNHLKAKDLSNGDMICAGAVFLLRMYCSYLEYKTQQELKRAN